MGEEFAPESPRGDSGAVCSLLVDAVVDDDADDRPDREDMDGPLMSRSTDLRRPRNPEDTSISVLLLLPALFPILPSDAAGCFSRMGVGKSLEGLEGAVEREMRACRGVEVAFRGPEASAWCTESPLPGSEERRPPPGVVGTSIGVVCGASPHRNNDLSVIAMH